MRKRPLLLTACVFLTGLAYQRYSQWEIVVVGLLLVFRECWKGRQTREFKKAAGRSLVLLSAFLLGNFYMQQESDSRAAYMSKIEDGSRITVWGELIKMESTEYGNRGILSDCYIDFGEGAMPCNDVMVYLSNDQCNIGQIHKVIGKVNMFSNARNEGNFDALVYYQSLKIDFAVSVEEDILLSDTVSGWKVWLYSLKERISQVYELCFTEKATGFYQAMVLGEKDKLDVTLKELFLLGGISHILAISGLHVSILGRGIYRFLRKGGISFGVAGVCGGMVLVFYCIMVGKSVSTVRAIGMLLLFFLAQWIGRSYDMLNSLGGMVLLLLWENPFLIENSGFWFSVMALVGIGFVGKEMLHGWEKAGGLWLSLGITLTTLPVTALSYYEIPIYSTMVNFLLLPLLTPVFALAVIVGLLGACGLEQNVTAFLLAPCEWLCTFYEWFCELVARLPNTTVICGKPKMWQVVLYYVVLFGGMYGVRLLRERKMKRRNVVQLALVLCCVCYFFLPKEKPFEISFLDVGQGDGIYISAGDGTTYFIDGGSLSVDCVGEYRILPFLKAKGVRAIDYWFVSHCDTDHISGLYEIIEKGYKIKHIVLFEQCSDEEKQKKLIFAAEKAGIEVLYMKAGHGIHSEDMAIRCIAPIVENGNPIGEDANENSLVLQVEWHPKGTEEKFIALFAGDISSEIENALCERGLLKDVDLVKANHHGSNYSNSEKWFATVRPEYIVVSCGKNNLYGHPGAKAVERMEESGADIFYTMENGQITFPLIQ